MRSHISDPGSIPLKLRPPDGFLEPATCRICEGWKPPRAHHSQLTNRCVFRMDHACKWIGNVVGYSNQKYFILLLVYACTLAVSNCIILSGSLWGCYSLGSHFSRLEVVFLVINVTGFFICRSYLSDQLEFIESNVTLIETFQNSQGRSDGVDVFRQVFGRNPWLWPLPIFSSAPPDYTEPVFAASSLSKKDADSLGVDLYEKLD